MTSLVVDSTRSQLWIGTAKGLFRTGSEFGPDIVQIRVVDHGVVSLSLHDKCVQRATDAIHSAA